MPAGRIILKSISESKKLSKVKTDGARLLYTWLIPHLDVNGCFSGDPVVINGQVLTRLSKSFDTVQGYLQDLAETKLIVLYSLNGDEFLIVPDFQEKQPQLRPEKEAKPTIPLPTPDQLRTKSRPTPELPRTSKVKESKVKESKVREFVRLTQDQLEKLSPSFSKDKLEWMFDKLDAWQSSKGKPKIINAYGYFKKGSWLIEEMEKKFSGKAPEPDQEGQAYRDKALEEFTPEQQAKGKDKLIATVQGFLNKSLIPAADKGD